MAFSHLTVYRPHQSNLVSPKQNLLGFCRIDTYINLNLHPKKKLNQTLGAWSKWYIVTSFFITFAPMASRSLNDLNEILSAAYQKACIEYGKQYPNAPQPFITCTFRSNDEQDTLYQQGRGLKGKIITNARASESPHNYTPSAAFDIAFITVGKKLDWSAQNFKNFAEIIIRIQPLVEWGGGWKFKDAPHFQLKDWRKYVA